MDAAASGARGVRRAVIRERARCADERRLNAFARSLAGGTGWLNGLAEEAAYGKTVWSWHPWLVSSWRRFAKPNRAMRTVNSSATEARGIRLRGELGISRKTIAQGMPGCSGCTCMLVCAFLSASCTRDRGCSRHPAFPAPSDSQEGTSKQASGATRREIVVSHSVVIVREGGRSSIPETPMIEPISRGVLDHPPFAGDDSY